MDNFLRSSTVGVLELIKALKKESKIGISASKAKEMIAPQRGRSWTGIGVFLEASKKELEITSLAKRLRNKQRS